MRSNSTLFRAGMAALLLAAFALSGCGRNGPPEAPPSAAATKGEDGSGANKGAAQTSEPEKPNKRIFLDNLL
jgi:predicted small lipoprotein YifL